jgi:cell division protein FtsZ
LKIIHLPNDFKNISLDKINLAIESATHTRYSAPSRINIKVIGIGGGGGNAVQHMIERNVQGVEFVCANTDTQALGRSDAHKLIQLGMSGLGAGSKPEKGREAALMAEKEIRDAIEGTHMLFIAAGMGGGTGTGGAPVIARIAREMGILTVAVVTMPFDFEGEYRMAHAEAGLTELEGNVDSLIVVHNEKLLDTLGEDVSVMDAFGCADDVLKNAVNCIASIINVAGIVNVDFEDVRTLMSEVGKAVIGSGLASGDGRARAAVDQAIGCPLLDGAGIADATGALILISAAKGMLKLDETKLVVNTVRTYIADDAKVIYGISDDETMLDHIKVIVIATGLIRANAATPALRLLRTGTDDIPVLETSIYGVAIDTAKTKNDKPTLFRALVDKFAKTPQSRTNEQTTVSMSEIKQDDGTADQSIPAFSRLNREIAADKVNALSSGGMDDLEIPAFLRRQAD